MTPISRVRGLGSKRPTYESAYGLKVRPVELPEQLEGTVGGGESDSARVCRGFSVWNDGKLGLVFKYIGGQKPGSKMSIVRAISDF